MPFCCVPPSYLLDFTGLTGELGDADEAGSLHVDFGAVGLGLELTGLIGVVGAAGEDHGWVGSVGVITDAGEVGVTADTGELFTGADSEALFQSVQSRAWNC